MKTKNFFLWVLLFVISGLYSQDQIFLNSNQSFVTLNPSFAGSNGFIRNQTSFQTFEAANVRNDFSYVNSLDAFLKSLKAGVAITTLGDYWSDSRGSYRNNFVRISYAQYISLLAGRLKIIPSFELGYGQKQYGGEWHTGPTNYFADRAGLLVNYGNKLFLGISGSLVSLFSLSTGNQQFYNSGSNYHLSYNLKASDKIRLQFSGVAFERSGELAVLLTSVNMISFNHFITGIGLANLELPLLNIGYRTNYFSVGAGFWYGRDSGPAKLHPVEFHASFNLRNKEQRKVLTSFETW